MKKMEQRALTAERERGREDGLDGGAEEARIHIDDVHEAAERLARALPVLAGHAARNDVKGRRGDACEAFHLLLAAVLVGLLQDHAASRLDGLDADWVGTLCGHGLHEDGGDVGEESSEGFGGEHLREVSEQHEACKRDKIRKISVQKNCTIKCACQESVRLIGRRDGWMFFYAVASYQRALFPYFPR
jgi:hypothetical protein